MDAVLRGPAAGSDPEPVTVQPDTTPGVDAPVAPLSLGAALTLTGGGLATTDRVFLWPDAGIRSPNEALDMAPTSVSASTVTVNAAALSGLRAIPYRVSLRQANGTYTPFVLLEVTP
jgi:hypothetical protein